MSQTLTYTVLDMSCGHCKAAVSRGLLAVTGVTEVDVDLETKHVVVKGALLDDETLRTAIVEAGYAAA